LGEQSDTRGDRQTQAAIAWANHLVILYPLWLGAMPALLKGFLEQVLRPGFAFEYRSKGMPKKLLTGKSARIVVTMGMPALVYRWYFGAHSLKSLERNILRFVGIGPIRASLIGMIEGKNARREKWINKMGALGRAGH
jgi:putative NADPH-quinone reductase